MSSSGKQLSLPGLLASGAERVLRDGNPWWRGERLFGLPPHRRWAFAPTLKGLRRGLAPITVLRGPRQVGKTTLLNQIVDTLLNEGVQPLRIFRIQFDDIPLLLREIGQLRGLGTIDPLLAFNGLAPLRDKAFWLELRSFGEQHRPLRNAAFRWFSELDATLLVRLVEPLELRLKRRKGESKLILSDHSLRAARLQEQIPLVPEALADAPQLSDLAGRIAESAAGQLLESVINLGVHHFPERGSEPEVDFVLTVGDQRIPVEVKYRRRIDHADTRGLRALRGKERLQRALRRARHAARRRGQRRSADRVDPACHLADDALTVIAPTDAMPARTPP